MADTLIWASVAYFAIAGVWHIFHRSLKHRHVSELEHRIEMAEQNAKTAMELAAHAEEYARGVANRSQQPSRWGRQ